MREQQEMLKSQQEVYKAQTKDSMDSILSAVNHLIKEALKPEKTKTPRKSETKKPKKMERAEESW